MKTPRGTSESSTTSDNTSEFIDIVKKYDVVYNTHNQDYKNVEIKMKVWSQIAEEIGLSVDASKRKWKNLRDSYTKYLRSFRVGTKTSKKYQYWAHAEHMDFLKPYQGPGRNPNNAKSNDNDDDGECDLGYQVLAKASEEDLKTTTLTENASHHNANEVTVATGLSGTNAINPCTTSMASTMTGGGTTMAIPSLPSVQLPPPPLACKPILTPISSSATISSTVQTQSNHIFPLPTLMSTNKNSILQIPTTLAPTNIPSTTSSSSSVGCLIIEPQLFATSDPTTATLKKDLNLSLGVLHSITSSTVNTQNRSNPPLVTKIRRVQPSTKPSSNIILNTSAASVSSTNSTNINSSAVTTSGNHPPPPKSRKLPEHKCPEIDINTVLQAARELDANTLFFLSLARSVRSMPTKYQSMAKMRCLRIVSDIELELDNITSSTDSTLSENHQVGVPAVTASSAEATASTTEAGTEHFVYVMSPSRVESMIDISSDEDAAQNAN